MIELIRTFPVTRKDAFAFLLDVSRWNEWTPLHTKEATAFAAPGDQIAVGYRSFRIPLSATATLDEVTPGEAFTISLRVPGSLPLNMAVDLVGTGTRGAVVRVIATFDVPGGHLARSLWSMSPGALVAKRELGHAFDRAHDLLAGPLIGD